jgi:hypothetical protein
MPTYVYEIIDETDERTRYFEVVQSMRDEPLTHHPESGRPVRRVIQPPHIAGKWSEARTKETYQNNKRLGELGFTKYVKAGDGYYEKAAGSGPDTLHAD